MDITEGRRIDDLPPSPEPTRLAQVAAMQGGTTVLYTLDDVLGLIEAEDVQAGIAAATADNTVDDTDELVYLTGLAVKRVALAGLLTSIFKTARTIANAQFASATFKLFNAADTPRALTFNTTALTADRVITVPDANVALATPVFTKSYDSGQQTITTSGTLSLSHGLGEAPKLTTIMLQCTTAEAGYSIGDVVALLSPSDLAAGANRGLSLVPNSSTIEIKFGSTATNTFTVINKSTGAVVGATNANWRLIVRAWA